MKRRIFHYGTYPVGSIILCTLILLPIGALIGLAATPTENIWPGLGYNILPRQLFTTLLLMLGVGVLTGIAGTLTAWVVTFFHFPGRGFFSWGLLLPLSLPTYIAAYVYGEFMSYTGSIYKLWHTLFPTIAFPQIYSLTGAIFILSGVLFPYVYISARAAFLQQTTTMVESARILGLTPMHCFLRIGLPLARPAIAAGISLCLMECLNDIGAVEYLGVSTLTMGVYDTWLLRGNLGGAAQLALILLCLAGGLIYIERWQRHTRGYHTRHFNTRSYMRFTLPFYGKCLAFLICSLPLICGFFLPVSILLKFAVTHPIPFSAFSTSLGNSLLLASIAAGVTVLCALYLAFYARIDSTKISTHLARFAALGYAIPGTVLAIAFLGVIAFVSDISFGHIFIGGGIFVLIFVYMVRFMALAYGTCEAGFIRIPTTIDMAARSLGARRGALLSHIHIPLLRASLIAAFLLVFVDVAKELPATLILRPFDFETLATMIYNYASLGQIEEAAMPALIIILLGLIPIMLMLSVMDWISSARKHA